VHGKLGHAVLQAHLRMGVSCGAYAHSITWAVEWKLAVDQCDDAIHLLSQVLLTHLLGLVLQTPQNCVQMCAHVFLRSMHACCWATLML